MRWSNFIHTYIIMKNIYSAVLNLLLQSIIISNSNAHTLSKTCIIQLFFLYILFYFNVEVTFKLVAVRLEWLIFFHLNWTTGMSHYYKLCCNYLAAICTMIFRIKRIMVHTISKEIRNWCLWIINWLNFVLYSCRFVVYNNIVDLIVDLCHHSLISFRYWLIKL